MSMGSNTVMTGYKYVGGVSREGRGPRPSLLGRAYVSHPTCKQVGHNFLFRSSTTPKTKIYPTSATIGLLRRSSATI
ncbi:hypothetical protein E2C01_066530 [Portunus trituberculatus]|uniref:Uncharacterized protein n=1 Tax=Portunus trituberculatus TaxID=210409 RepID=A0A5B7HLS2_PORTR|nr:hypothetical protein [Portunus trituberculatus]